MTTIKNYDSGSEDQPTVHTPGPWKVSRRFDIYQDNQETGFRGTYIGTTRGNGPLPDTIEKADEQNACLIAAAPDLLAACRVVLAAIEQANLGGEVLWINRGSPVHESASERLADVIEQATGERNN